MKRTDQPTGQYKIKPNPNTKYVLIYYVINAGLFFSLDPIPVTTSCNTANDMIRLLLLMVVVTMMMVVTLMMVLMMAMLLMVVVIRMMVVCGDDADGELSKNIIMTRYRD